MHLTQSPSLQKKFNFQRDQSTLLLKTNLWDFNTLTKKLSKSFYGLSVLILHNESTLVERPSKWLSLLMLTLSLLLIYVIMIVQLSLQWAFITTILQWFCIILRILFYLLFFLYM